MSNESNQMDCPSYRNGLAVFVVLIAVACCIVVAGRAYVAASSNDWIAMLKDADSEVRWRGVMYLNDLAPPTPAVMDALMGALTDEYFGVRQQATHGIGKFGAAARQAIPLLMRAMNDQDAYVRRYAKESLHQIER